MIPRYRPTYGYHDLFSSLFSFDARHNLIAELRRLYGVKHAFLFDSGRSALAAVLRACGRGGEVILPGYTCMRVPQAVVSAGCIPVFADIAERSVNMDAASVERSISPRTTAVIITHQFGLPADVHETVDLCRRHNLLAVEDAAPSVGASVDGALVGTFADAAVISFGLTKVLSAGSGGALLTRDADVAAKTAGPAAAAQRAGESSAFAFCRALAWKVATSDFVYPALRLARTLVCDEAVFQTLPAPAELPKTMMCADCVAALLRRQLADLDRNIERRGHRAAIYERELDDVYGIELSRVPRGSRPAWIQYPVFASNKAGLIRELLRKSIDLSWTFRYSTADSYGVTSCPNARRAAQTVVGLPTYPRLSEIEAYRICAAIRSFAGARSAFAAVA